MMQKQQQYEENTTRLYPTNRPQNNSEEIKAELLKFQIELKQNGISAIHQHLQANTTTKQTFITLIIHI